MIATENKLACADFTFPLLKHDQVLQLIKIMDFEGVDIGLFEDRSHIQPSMVLDVPQKKGSKLKRRVRDAGLEITDVFLQCDLDFTAAAVNHPDENVRNRVRNMFEQFTEYACAAGCRHITCLPGAWFAGEEYDVSFARAVEELYWRAALAAQMDLVLGVEAHIGSIADTPQKALRLIQATPGLTLTLDYSHFKVMGIPDSEVHPLVEHASHFHLRGASKGRLQTAMAENAIDYKAVFKQMKKTGYHDYIGIEYTWTEWENCNKTDNVSESILARDLVRKSVV